MNEQRIKECFNTDTEEYGKMFSIINAAKSRTLTQEESIGTQVHHIIPRSYFKKKNISIDNSEDNLVTLSKQEHCLVHYYAWKCATPLIRKSMAYTVHLMIGTFTKDVNEELMFSIVSSFKNDDIRLPASHFSNEKFTCLERYGNKKFLWKCNKCGYEVKAGIGIRSCEKCRKENLKMDKDFVENVWYLIHKGIISWKIFEKYANITQNQMTHQAEIYNIEMKPATYNNQKDYILVNDTLYGTYSSISKKLNVPRTTIKYWEKEDKIDVEHINSDDCIESLIRYYKEDPDIINRLKELMDKMVELNKCN